jgi:hypothetical protein
MARDGSCNPVADCGSGQLDFFHLLAAALVVDSTGCVRLRVAVTVEECTEVDQFVDCSNAHVNPLEALKSSFSLDSCGRVVLNLSSAEVDIQPEQ